MSAMRAVELPEVPASTGPEAPAARPAAAPASPQDSAVDRAAVRWTGSHYAGPGQGRAASAPLRLTRRGRVVVAVAVALLLTALSLVAAGSALATSHAAPSRAGEQRLTQVTVRPGQSLWSVAEAADPNVDTRLVIQQIIDLNGLTGDTIIAGQRLWVPLG
jgi:hypothetical protein